MAISVPAVGINMPGQEKTVPKPNNMLSDQVTRKPTRLSKIDAPVVMDLG